MYNLKKKECVSALSADLCRIDKSVLKICSPVQDMFLCLLKEDCFNTAFLVFLIKNKKKNKHCLA